MATAKPSAALFLIFLAVAGAATPPHTEALLAWKASLGDPDALSTWRNATPVCTGWRGVACDEAGRVVSLHLQSLGISGAAQARAERQQPPGRHTGVHRPAALALLDLSFNLLEGTIPHRLSSVPTLLLHVNLSGNYLTSIPEFVHTNMSLMDLSLNSFTGPIPGVLPPNLKYLDLSINAFTGRIPATLTRLAELRQLRVNGNNLSGGVPDFLGSMTRLRVLELAGNPLGGQLPPTLGRLWRLRRLDLKDSGLVSVVPPELGKLRKLQLTGALPASLAGMLSMREFGVSCNNFTGDIPGALLASWPQLISFQAHENAFTGNIPPEFGKGSNNLKVLYLFHNNLTGPIPPEISELKNLEELDLSFNLITGSIPSSFGSLKNLKRIALGMNELSGTIPPEVGSMSALQHFDVNDNKLEGELPTTFTSLRNLQSLRLFDNNITGTIPPDLGKGVALVVVNPGNNRFYGELPQNLCDGLVLQNLTTHNNNFSGKLPPCLKNCTDLYRVRLEQNQFIGNISEAFGIHPNLAYLDVSGNELTGQLTTEWEKCTNISFLHMEDNLISGSIPTGFGKMEILQDLNIAGNLLTGAIPPMAVVVLLASIAICCLLIACRRREANPEFVVRERDTRLTFSFRDIVNVTQNFSNSCCIGKGGFGAVYRAQLLSRGLVVAVKRIHVVGAEDRNKKRAFENEVQTLSLVRHRNIVRLIGFCTIGEYNYLLYNYLERGTLWEALHGEESSSLLNWGLRSKVIKGLAHAVDYLHNDCNPAIVHGDITSSNILLDSEFEPHLSDFGNANTLGSSTRWTRVVGSHGYMAPELAQNTQRSTEADIYSYGVVLLEILTGKMAVEPSFDDDVDIVSWVLSRLDSTSQIEALCDPSIVREISDTDRMEDLRMVLNLAVRCASKVAGQRPSIANVVNELRGLGGGMATTVPQVDT
nr:unnamed protein product [Digitaria exilis]